MQYAAKMQKNMQNMQNMGFKMQYASAEYALTTLLMTRNLKQRLSASLALASLPSCDAARL